MRIFIIHSSGMTKQALAHAEKLEAEGHETYVPLRDTEQVATTMEQIFATNLRGIKWSDECHLLWDLSSQGTLFDLGSAYALGKPIHVIETRKNHWTKFVSSREGQLLFDEPSK